MPDAVTILRADHRTVEKLFKQFEKLGDRAMASRTDLVAQMVRELSIHAAIEEQVLYPVSRHLDSTEDVTLESLEEHRVVKMLLSDLDGMDPEHERFDARVTVLMEMVRHHVEEEEGELFPKLRQTLKARELRDLGEALETAKKVAPTRPHPHAPDEGPANVLVGAVAGVVDRLRDAASAMVGR